VPIPEPVAAVPEVSPAAPPPVMPTLRSVLAEPVASPLAASSAAPATILAPIPLVSLAKPAAAKPEPDAAAALTPHLPPTVQNLPAEPAPAPPALPLGRFDQHSLQSLFMTDETLDLPQVSRLAAGLPGMQGCVIVARGESYSGGLLPEGFHLNALRGLAPQVGAAADRLPIGELKNFTLYGEQYSVSFFERRAVCLCAVHRARSFVPGVREKLVAVVEELARG
jgi:hypothetical protein